MLLSLSIRDFVLIDQLDLKPGDGFCALTGETGAGKSILLEALMLALGAPADKAQIRAGAKEASITAEFALAADHPAFGLLADQGLTASGNDTLMLRRLIRASGPARAFVNDTAVSASLLASLGETLIEIHGQHAAAALMKPSAHRALIDQYGGHFDVTAGVMAAYATHAAAQCAERALAEDVERAARHKAYLIDIVAELDRLHPEPGEAERLTETRLRLMQSERATEAVEDADAAFHGAHIDTALSQAARAVERLARLPGFEGQDAPLPNAARAAGEALERALIEAAEAAAALQTLKRFANPDTRALEAAEARLFALRAAARKHNVPPEQLPTLHARLAGERDLAEASDAALQAAAKKSAAARAAYVAAAARLTAARETAARKLARAVAKEFEPLKLGRAKFRVDVTPLSESQWGAAGADHIEFEIETNPGAGFGALRKIASGGELARVSLALKCALAENGAAGTLIFDEVDQGVGGAVAAAIGERLAHLAGARQVMAVTHSPQVAACAGAQWRVEKTTRAGSGATRLVKLEGATRLEEIARMLAGSEVTDEARAAAGRLLEDV